MSAVRWLCLFLLALNTTGCGTFMARSLVRAPNRYPSWFACEAPVTLAFNPKLLTNFAAQYVEVGPPPARLCYRVIEPADYHFVTRSTNWVKHGRSEYEFTFRATVPAAPNRWTSAPKGTVLLLHGYGLAQFSMMPWAFLLAEEGWRCILVDLRGHGKSTGKEIYFGLKETGDLSRLLDALARDKELAEPVDVMGESYGASLAIRWKTVDPRVGSVVAIAPYGSLSNTVMNIREQYAPWMPKWWVRAGLRELPSVLNVPAAELDITTVLGQKPVAALFVAGTDDQITPPNTVKQLYSMALPQSQLLVVTNATHESLTYYFSDLRVPVLAWLGSANE